MEGKEKLQRGQLLRVYRRPGFAAGAATPRVALCRGDAAATSAEAPCWYAAVRGQAVVKLHKPCRERCSQVPTLRAAASAAASLAPESSRHNRAGSTATAADGATKSTRKPGTLALEMMQTLHWILHLPLHLASACRCLVPLTQLLVCCGRGGAGKAPASLVLSRAAGSSTVLGASSTAARWLH